MNLSDLSGGVAVLTGAGSVTGLGFGLAKKAAKLGMHVVISDVRQSAVDEAVAELGNFAPDVRVEGYTCDVTDYTSVESLLTYTTTRFSGLPIKFLAANAGVLFPKTTIITGDPKEWDLTYRVNVIGLFHTLRVFVPHLIAQKERSAVEITASMAGVVFGMTGPYGTSKLAALGVAEALHSELKDAGHLGHVSVVALCPGLVNTALRESSSEVTGGEIQGMGSVEEDVSSKASVDMFASRWAGGMTADYCAEELFDHLGDGRFYCLLNNSSTTDPVVEAIVNARYNAMTSRRLEMPVIATATTSKSAKARL